MTSSDTKALWLAAALVRLPPNHALIRNDDGMWRVSRFPNYDGNVCRSIKVYPTASGALRAFYKAARKENTP